MSYHQSNEPLFVVEVMPESLRDDHRKANNWGRYPHNGAIRMVCTEAEASELCDGDEYNEIIREASLEDERGMRRYDGGAI